MQLRLVVLSALLSLAAIDPHQTASAQTASAAPPPLPSILYPTFPRDGADHVVTYTSWRGWGPKGGDRVVRIRRGSLVRIDTSFIGSRRDREPAQTTGFANLATGASLDLVPGAEGKPISATFSGGRRADKVTPLPSFERTGEGETIAGEQCEVWSAQSEISAGSHVGVDYSTCVTKDGIPLRSTVFFSDGSVMHEIRAIQIERRTVPLSQALPPGDVLDWSAWNTPSQISVEQLPNPQNYALTLVNQSAAGRNPLITRTYRAEGGWQIEENRSSSAEQSITIIGLPVSFSFRSEGPDLTISRGPHALRLGGPGVFDAKPIERAATTVLGERCTWFDAAVGVSDYSRYECRSSDSLPLIIDESSWGSRVGNWVATAITRGKTPAGSIQPPVRLMNWIFWGWPELER